MSTRISEFTDSYSDDMMFLTSLRRILLRHPLQSFAPLFLDATLSRLYAVMLVGNVENAIAQEFDRNSEPKLDTYLNANVANATKVQALEGFLQERLSASVDTSILDDYLAIKYLRNGIIHSDQRTGAQAEYIKSHGFPIDSRDLTLVHLKRMARVDQSITMYFGMSRIIEVLGVNADYKPEINLPSSPVAEDESVSAPYSLREFDQIHRRNLQNTAVNWQRFRSKCPPDSAGTLVSRLWSGEHGSESLDVQSWGESAEYSWNQVVGIASESGQRLFKDAEHRADQLARIRSLAVDGAFPRGPLPADAYQAISEVVSAGEGPGDEALSTLFQGHSPLSGSQLVESYALGYKAYDLTTSLGVDWIWPVLAQGASNSRIELVLAFIDLCELGRSWYMAIEHHTSFEPEKLETHRREVIAMGE